MKTWLDKVESLNGLSWLISAHYSGKVRFTKNEVKSLKIKVDKSSWPKKGGDLDFLSWLDGKLLKIGVVPKDPLEKFSD